MERSKSQLPMLYTGEFETRKKFKLDTTKTISNIEEWLQILKENGQRYKIKPKVIFEMIQINRINERKSKCNKLNFIDLFNRNVDYLVDICNNDGDISERRGESFLIEIITLIKAKKRKQYNLVRERKTTFNVFKVPKLMVKTLEEQQEQENNDKCANQVYYGILPYILINFPDMLPITLIQNNKINNLKGERETRKPLNVENFSKSSKEKGQNIIDVKKQNENNDKCANQPQACLRLENLSLQWLTACPHEINSGWQATSLFTIGESIIAVANIKTRNL